MNIKEKCIFSLKTWLTSALILFIFTSAHMMMGSIVMFLFGYLALLSGPIIGFTELRHAGNSIMLLYAALFLCPMSWCFLLWWKKTNRYILSVPIILWTATGAWGLMRVIIMAI